MTRLRLGHKRYCGFHVGVYHSLSVSAFLCVLSLSLSVSLSICLCLSVFFSPFLCFCPLFLSLLDLLPWGNQLQCHEQPYGKELKP